MAISRRLLIGGAVALYLVVAILGAWQTWLHSHDDAYITFVFARNFAEGNGLTWNGGEGLGTTSPLLAVTLGSLERLIPLGIPMWGHLLAWTAIFTTACALFLLGRREGWPTAGFLAGLGWLISPAVVEFLGGEYPIAVAAISLAALAAAGRRTPMLALCLAIAVGLRTEMGLMAMLLAAVIVARDGWRGSTWLVKGAAGALALWGAWLLLLYRLAGTALPASLDAKRAQAESPFPFFQGGTKFLAKVFRAADEAFYPAGLWIFGVLAFIGALYLIWQCRRRPRWLLAAGLTLWGPLHLAALTILNVPYYPWYGMPMHFSMMVLVALTSEIPRRLAERLRGTVQIAAAALLAIVVLGNGVLNLERHRDRYEDPREPIYTRISEWISTRYPPTTRVATFEVGYLGFYGRFVTLDLLGLTTPETPLDAIREGDFPRVLETLDPDLVFLPMRFPALGRALIRDAARFLSEFELDHVFYDRWSVILLYRRRDVHGHGSVTHDLLSVTTDGKVAYRQKRWRGAPTLILGPGETRRREIDSTDGVKLSTALGASHNTPVTARIRLLDPEGHEIGQVQQIQNDHGWLAWSHEVPDTAAGSTLEFSCLSESASACMFAIPHLWREPPT